MTLTKRDLVIQITEELNGEQDKQEKEQLEVALGELEAQISLIR